MNMESFETLISVILSLSTRKWWAHELDILYLIAHLPVLGLIISFARIFMGFSAVSLRSCSLNKGILLISSGLYRGVCRSGWGSGLAGWGSGRTGCGPAPLCCGPGRASVGSGRAWVGSGLASVGSARASVGSARAWVGSGRGGVGSCRTGWGPTPTG